jgi:hypothetical protein
MTVPQYEKSWPQGQPVAHSLHRKQITYLSVPTFRAMIPTVMIGCAGWPPPILCFPACLLHRFDIPVLDGKIP